MHVRIGKAFHEHQDTRIEKKKPEGMEIPDKKGKEDCRGEPSGFALAEAKLRPSYAGQVGVRPENIKPEGRGENGRAASDTAECG
jgi:hypothetical protein